MNILLLTNCIKQPDDTDKSINDIVFYFAKEWKKNGHNVIIVNNESKFPYFFYKIPSFIIKIMKKRGNFTVPSLASRQVLRWEKEGIKIIRLPLFKLYPHASFKKNKYEFQSKRIIQYLDECNFVPDVVTGHWIEPQLKLVDFLGKYYNAKKALVIHGELPHNLSKEYCRIIEQLDVLFFRSYYVRNKMERLYGNKIIDSTKIKVCYSGIPNKFVISQKKRNDWKNSECIRFIYVGRLERYKRVDATLKALSIAFPDKNFIFDIVGDGPEWEYLHNRCKELDLLNNVNFIGRIQREEVIKRMNNADCFIMISEYEVFGLVYLEAMACGCLTIASLEGGVDGIIKHHINGFLCKQGDYLNLADILDEINSLSKSEIIKIRNEAYSTVEDYTDNKAAEHYIKSIVNS